MHCLRTHKFLFLAKFSLKMSPTVLFTYFKFILLQCFLILVFSFQLYPNGPIETPLETYFLVSLSIVESILVLHMLL